MEMEQVPCIGHLDLIVTAESLTLSSKKDRVVGISPLFNQLAAKENQFLDVIFDFPMKKAFGRGICTDSW